ncbi:MAG TPA: 23S rRNA (guanosine(2251)-2'-O)-methyltransferase RlmB [Candidatus Micrarchaeia archaeon]|nr:23S rRNA (guanosine(2251)-2'-O)-methyltransferase RlmB [Candidatus Micrarchaeia archaeon]
MPEILYGRHPVLEALRAGREPRRILVASGLERDPRLAEVLTRAAGAGAQVETRDRRQLDDVAHSEHHQGVVAYFDRRQLGGLHRLRELVLAQLSSPWPPLVLCLDELQDPQNLGALVRSAEACRATAVVTLRHRSAPVSAAVAKAAAGATEHLPLLRVTNLRQALDGLREWGVWVVGLDAGARDRYDAVDYRLPVALVVGTEGTGMRPLTRATCDRTVRLPMGGRVASLNAAVAGGILLYEVARQRDFAFPPRS